MSASAIRAGRAFVELTTRDGSLNKGIAAAQKKLKTVAAVAGQIGKQTAAGLGKAQSVLQSFSGSVLNLKSVIASSIVVVGLKSAVAQFTDAGQKMVEAMQITGASAEQLNRMGFGSWISTRDVVSAFRLNAAIGVLGDSFAAVQNVIGGALAPMLTEVIYRITRAVNSVRRWIDSNRNAVVVIAQVAAGVGLAGGALLALAGTAAIVSTAIGVVVGVAGWLSAAFAVATAAIGAILSPIGLVIVGVAALGAAILYYTGAGSSMLQWLGDQFKWLSDVVMPVLDAIKTALMSGQFAAAGKVLFTSLEIAFRVGTARLYGIWVDTSTMLLNVWTDVAGGIRDAMAVTIDWLLGAWDSTVTYIAKKLLYLYSLFDMSFDYQQATEQMDKDFQSRANKRNTDLTQARDEREQTKTNRLNQAEENKNSFNSRIKDLQESLKESFAEIKQEARRQDKLNAIERVKLPQIQDLAALTKGVTAVGTSSGFAADRLGAGREATGFAALLREVKNTNKLIERQTGVIEKKPGYDYSEPRMGP